MLHISYPSYSPFINLGILSRGPVFPYPAFTEDSAKWVVSYFDPFNNIGQGNDFWHTGARTEIDTAFGFTELHGNGGVQISYPPNTYHEDPIYDEAVYGNTLTKGGRIFLDHLYGVKLPSRTHENFCRHANVHGAVSTLGSNAPSLVQGNVSVFGANYPCLRLEQLPWNWAKLVSLQPSAYEIYPPVNNTSCFFLLSFLDSIKRNGFVSPQLGAPVWAPPGTYIQVFISNLSYTNDWRGALVISYTVTVEQREYENYTLTQTFTWRATITHSGLEFITPVRDRVLYDWYEPYVLSPSRVYSYSSYRTWKHPDYTYPNYAEPTSYTVGYTTTYPAISGEIPQYSQDLLGLAAAKVSEANFHQLHSLRQFRDAVNHSWGDILPSSLHSTVNAFTNVSGSLGTNNLETLAELGDLVDAWPDVKLGLRILSDFYHKDLTSATIGHVLDLTTKTTLQASFVWGPTAELITKQLPIVGKVISQFDQPKKLTVGHGIFQHTIINDLSRAEVHLTTKTKLVLDVSLSGLMSSVLKLDELGVLPRTSRAWDTIPMSFVADWVLGIGNLLERMETSILLMTLPCYYVHTYKLTSPLTEDELDTLRVTNAGTERPYLSIYNRDVSLYVPVPRFSRFNFGLPTSGPYLGLVGSLFYQLFKR